MSIELAVKLSDRELEIIKKEITRLRNMYDIKVDYKQFISLLIEQHRLKLRLTAEQEDASEALAWLWRKKNDEEAD